MRLGSFHVHVETKDLGIAVALSSGTVGHGTRHQSRIHSHTWQTRPLPEQWIDAVIWGMANEWVCLKCRSS